MSGIETGDAKSVRAQCIDLAVQEGTRAAVGAGILAGTAVVAANKFSPWFHKSLGVSGKVGTVMMAITGSFFLFAEMALLDAQRHPEAYGFEHVDGAEHAENAAELAKLHKLHITPRHIYAKAANHLYDHPFQMIIGMSLPVIGGFFYQESKKPGLKLSQRIIHTRVQGQASVILILALTMGFREYMQKQGGRIKIEDEDE